jgi:hypothetical protein
MINNIIKKGWKTTIIGIVIILAAIASVFFAGQSWWPQVIIAVGVGLAMLFTPGKVLDFITSFLNRKGNENEK